MCVHGSVGVRSAPFRRLPVRAAMETHYTTPSKIEKLNTHLHAPASPASVRLVLQSKAAHTVPTYARCPVMHARSRAPTWCNYYTFDAPFATVSKRIVLVHRRLVQSRFRTSTTQSLARGKLQHGGGRWAATAMMPLQRKTQSAWAAQASERSWRLQVHSNPNLRCQQPPRSSG